ncbi:thiopeptide-type bacteriocin biosynthesis protein [Streptomyces calvus]
MATNWNTVRISLSGALDTGTDGCDDSFLSLPGFIWWCAASLQGDGGSPQDGGENPPGRHEDPESATLIRLRDVFLAGGLRQITRQTTPDSGWVQINLTPVEERRRDLYEGIREFGEYARSSGVAKELYFMHKPPGVRLRLRACSGRERDLALLATRQARSLSQAGVVSGYAPGVYEAESCLFGGSASMRWVHELFSVDSRLWLAYHASPSLAASEPAWALSLVMTSHLLDSLSITGWERLDVWERVRRAGRALRPAVARSGEIAEALRKIQSVWTDPARALDSMSAASQSLLAEHQASVAGIGRGWRTHYFDSGEALIGPREAASLAIVFHWNRAGIAPMRQALITEALADRYAWVPT